MILKDEKKTHQSPIFHAFAFSIFASSSRKKVPSWQLHLRRRNWNFGIWQRQSLERKTRSSIMKIRFPSSLLIKKNYPHSNWGQENWLNDFSGSFFAHIWKKVVKEVLDDGQITDRLRQDECQWSSIWRTINFPVWSTYFTPTYVQWTLLTSWNLIMTPLTSTTTQRKSFWWGGRKTTELQINWHKKVNRHLLT